MSFVDICLTCEKPTTGEAYCSQVCRLHDLDSSSPSASSSPMSSVFPAHSPAISSTHSPSASGTGFFLPPPIDFSALRSARGSGSGGRRGHRTGASSAPNSRPNSLFLGGSVGGGSKQPRGLSSSSSQASLSSMNACGEGLSRQAREELREYTSSFDQVRDLRRRMTTTA